MNHPHHPDEQDHRAMEAERDAWSARYPHRWVRPARPAEPELDAMPIRQWLIVAAILAAFAIALVVLG